MLKINLLNKKLMKNKYSYLLLTFLLNWNILSVAQLTKPHQSQSPPHNPGYPFTRGMFVDCADKIINEISTGNTNSLQLELNNYIRNNYISYIILCGLEHANIFGNPSMETALALFMNRTRTAFPGIQIGISGSDSGSFQITAPLILPKLFAVNSFPIGSLNNFNDLNHALNDAGIKYNNLKKSELCKFFFRAAQFGNLSVEYKYSINCKVAFDAFYLEYRYWNSTTSLLTIQNEFSNYKTILSVMNLLKYNYRCIKNIDAEFLPTEIFNLQAWTAIDQITEADPLTDRLMIPVYSKNAVGVFDQVCKVLHFLSDRFSKPNSKIFIKLSAESSFFSYCNSTNTPHDYLGNYLNGTMFPSGNMYSVEKMFVDKFNNTNYLCSLCSCKPYNGNHYTVLNPNGNSLSGVMWTPFSMLKNHNLFRDIQATNDEVIENLPVLIQLSDLNGKIIGNYKTLKESYDVQNNNSLTDGIYFMKIVYKDGKHEIRKSFIHHR